MRFFDYIIDMETGKKGEVVDALALQFTALVDGRIRFYFYKDKNLTWVPMRKCHE